MTTLSLELDEKGVRVELSKAKAASVAVWKYVASHRMLELRLERRDGEVVHLLAEGCARIEAAAAWHASDFELERMGESFELRDQQARFCLVAQTLTIVTNVSGFESLIR